MNEVIVGISALTVIAGGVNIFYCYKLNVALNKARRLVYEMDRMRG